MAKYTDEQIKKALECCTMVNVAGGVFKCNNCPFVADCRSSSRRRLSPMKHILDLIKRQEAEIERLNIESQAMRDAANSYKMHNEKLEIDNRILSQKRMNIFEKCETFERGRIKGIKEFAERLKGIATATHKTIDGQYKYEITNDFIDNLVEEMEGENK